MKTAKKFLGEPFVCLKEWPEDCAVQCGDDGIVFTENSSYRTAYFEAFPRDPHTLIRGEGKTIQEAEESAWNQIQKHLACKKHKFERREYRNGAGFCVHCGLFNSKAYDPLEKCHICGVLTYHTCSINRVFYCAEHAHLIPDEFKTDIQKRFERPAVWLAGECARGG